jgi:hypothetical protein
VRWTHVKGARPKVKEVRVTFESLTHLDSVARDQEWARRVRHGARPVVPYIDMGLGNPIWESSVTGKSGGRENVAIDDFTHKFLDRVREESLVGDGFDRLARRHKAFSKPVAHAASTIKELAIHGRGISNRERGTPDEAA